MTSDVEKLENEIQPWNPGADLATEWDSADTIVGHDLVSKKDTPELFEQLCGVPFMITAGVFRYGDFQPKHLNYHPDYVSLEAIIPPEDVLLHRLKFRGISDTPFHPGQMIVFNDGSTGIRRQFVAYLGAKGLYQIPDGPREGGMGESVLDQPLTDTPEFSPRFEVRLTCPRGLRRSDYTNDYTQEGTTYYLG